MRPPTRAWDELVGNPNHHVMTSQEMAPVRTASSSQSGDYLRVYGSLTDCRGYIDAEDEGCHEIEERRPEHSDTRGQNPSRNQGSKRVGRVMKPVHEIKP